MTKFCFKYLCETESDLKKVFQIEILVRAQARRQAIETHTCTMYIYLNLFVNFL